MSLFDRKEIENRSNVISKSLDSVRKPLRVSLKFPGGISGRWHPAVIHWEVLVACIQISFFSHYVCHSFEESFTVEIALFRYFINLVRLSAITRYFQLLNSRQLNYFQTFRNPKRWSTMSLASYWPHLTIFYIVILRSFKHSLNHNFLTIIQGFTHAEIPWESKAEIQY